MTEGFRLARRLEADSLFLVDWPLCQVRLMDDSRFPWLILVPRRPGLEEWSELGPEDSAGLAHEIGKAGRALARMLEPTKINVGALGNIVRQMHVHVVARFDTDAAWPGPVWGQGAGVPYESAARDRLRAGLLALLE
ncbi:MAG: HIT domain-containing protein [Parvibaculaceae bacterium]